MNSSTKRIIISSLIGGLFYFETNFSAFSDQALYISPATEINAAFPSENSDDQYIYRSYSGGFLQGRGSKYVIAGRILNNRNCDQSRFDMNTVLDTAAMADSNDDAKEALLQGKGDALSLDELPYYCDFLYYDAANQFMAYPLTATKDVLQRIKLLAAVDNNNCNWDTETKKEIIRYAAINSRSQQVAGQQRSMLFIIYGANNEALYQIEDEGYSFGTAKGSELEKNCAVIAKFAEGLEW